MVLGMNAGAQGYDEPRGRDLYHRATERLRTVPGVESVTLSTSTPLFGGGFLRTIFRDDQDTSDPRNGRLTQVNEVDAAYFETLGIRLALGARQRDVRNMVVRHGVSLALGGVALGFVAAFWLARLVANLLFGVPPTDPVTFLTIPIVLVAVAVLATYIPALRASRVDPVDALRV